MPCKISRVYRMILRVLDLSATFLLLAKSISPVGHKPRLLKNIKYVHKILSKILKRQLLFYKKSTFYPTKVEKGTSIEDVQFLGK